jgi:GTP-binding protein
MKKNLVALVGRPNVGKSTLFNRLSIREKAIVHDRPGVTRDRKYAEAKIGPLCFRIVDTPGLEEAQKGQMEYSMMLQTIVACQEADLVCVMIDARSPVTPVDKFFADTVRKHAKKSVLIINKCENKSKIDQEYYRLGFSEYALISAEHGSGMIDLYELLVSNLPTLEEENGEKDGHRSEIIKLAIVGRPNAGKSTLVNSILGTERMLTGSTPGLTRESSAIDFNYRDHKIRLVDTPGLRKKHKIHDELEELSVGSAIRSIDFADICLLVVDASQFLETQDFKIAAYAVENGRALIVVINKWDLVQEKEKENYKDEVKFKIEQNLSQLQGVKILYISAINARNLDKLQESCIEAYRIWNAKISTPKLNCWLREAVSKHQPPMIGKNKRLRLKYITQIKSRPPTFKIFTNSTEGIDESYVRYLTNDMKEYFGLPGSVIRLFFSKSDNPYAKAKR